MLDLDALLLLPLELLRDVAWLRFKRDDGILEVFLLLQVGALISDLLMVFRTEMVSCCLLEHHFAEPAS